MDPRTIERVSGWDTHSFTGGLDGLSSLTDAEFTGALTVNDTWAFMLNGKIVGVFGGSIEDFDASGVTRYAAPDPALPLLFAMFEQSGEPRAKYYTNETPIDEVDTTLQAGSFTGYVELSEDILSGDYYLVYYGGRRMAAAYIGNAERLITGEEAYDRTADEVGIYRVYDVDISVTPVPEPTPEGSAESHGSTDRSDTSAIDDSADSDSTADSDTDEVDESEDGTVDEPADTDPPAETVVEASTSSGTDTVESETDNQSMSIDRSSPSPPKLDSERQTEGKSESEPTDSPFVEEEKWRSTRTIPSIDPERSTNVDRSDSMDPTHSNENKVEYDDVDSSPQHHSDTGTTVDSNQDVGENESTTQTKSPSTGNAPAVGQLHEENRSLHRTIDDLQSQISDLESDLERVRSVDLSDTTDRSEISSKSGLTGVDALSGTNLFVRYDSKSEPTLQTAHDDEADKADVDSNLRLEYHTEFEDDSVHVDGRSFSEYLAESIEYRFVDWLTGTLLYEIRETNHSKDLGDLYDVIPKIDRAELFASVSLADDDTEDVPDVVDFDVIAFDKRGDPLIVANFNDTRDPATDGMLLELEETASAVSANYPDFGAAFLVTSSFFSPSALDVTEEATASGLFSRGSNLSYVNVSRKRGYHLCLVEYRSGNFHVTVPEL